MNDYNKVLKKKDLRVGDTVKVMGKMDDYVDGWNNVWYEGGYNAMSRAIGKTFKITEGDSYSSGLRLDYSCSKGLTYRFPPHVLRRIRKGENHG